LRAFGHYPSREPRPYRTIFTKRCRQGFAVHMPFFTGVTAIRLVELRGGVS
jgi:hypothetical protein